MLPLRRRIRETFSVSFAILRRDYLSVQPERTGLYATLYETRNTLLLPGDHVGLQNP